MIKIKNTAITLLAALAMTTSAYAFEGLSIGVVGSQSSFDTKGHETKAQGGSATSMEKSAEQKKN